MGLLDHGSLGLWGFGTIRLSAMGLGDHGTLVPWAFGTMETLSHVTLASLGFVPMRLWPHETLAPGEIWPM